MTNRDSTDTTISELHRIRREMVARFGGDLHALTADAQKRAEASGRVILKRGEKASQATRPSGESPMDGDPR